MHIILSALALFVTLASPVVAQTISGVATVIDGDTIEIHDQRIRLHGIDSPEGGQTCILDGEPWRCGPAAALALSDLIGRRPLTCHQRDVDRYGRVVAMCEMDGLDIGEWMVAHGWALAYRQYSRTYIPNEDLARAEGRGIWASKFEAPWDWRRSGRSG